MAYVETTDWGTWKSIPQVAAYVNWNPSATPQTLNVVVIDEVPKGTKAVGGWFKVTSSGAGDVVSITSTGSSESRNPVITQVASVPVIGMFEVDLDSSYSFDVVATHLNISDVDIYITKIAL